MKWSTSPTIFFSKGVWDFHRHHIIIQCLSIKVNIPIVNIIQEQKTKNHKVPKSHMFRFKSERYLEDDLVQPIYCKVTNMSK